MIIKKLQPINFMPQYYYRIIQPSSILVLIPLFSSAFVQSPILSYFFYYDDFLHFFQAANTEFLEFIITPYGGHLYLTRNLFFFIFYKFFGLRAEFYFIIVLSTHILNVFLLFNFIKKLTSHLYLAAFGATLWGIYPINEGALGWYSAYGIVLTSTWLLLILYDVSRVIQNEIHLTRMRLVKWQLLLIAAATSYGLGLAISLSFVIVIWFFMYGEIKRKKATLNMLYIALLIPLMYIFMLSSYQVSTGLSHAVTQAGRMVRFISPSYWSEIFIMFFGGALLGLIVSLIWMSLSPKIRENRLIPFGPFLALAALIALVYGDQLIDLYISSVLR